MVHVLSSASCCALKPARVTSETTNAATTVEPMMTTGCSFAGSERMKERIAPYYVGCGTFAHASGGWTRQGVRTWFACHRSTSAKPKTEETVKTCAVLTPSWHLA